MIYDKLENAASYPMGPAFQKAVEFVKTLNASTPDGRYEVDGDKITARVMSYETQDGAPAKYEVHRNYADLQVLIAGHETIFVRMAEGLEVQTPYNAEKDCEFLSPDGKAAELNVQLFPGYFTLLLPQDAHMGKGTTCLGKCSLKKAVIKIALSELKN